MHLSRLFSTMVVVAVATGATIIACGGSSTPKKPDAKVFHDAPADSAGSGSGALGIGKDCTGTGSGNGMCPMSDPICTSLTGTKYFCTEGCGYGPCGSGGTFGSSSCGGGSQQPQPPSGGDAICMQQKSQTTGTPFCALFGDGPNAGSAIAWACAITCGTLGSANLGTCPTNLTCVSNFCQ
jgi:hypothetical protein